MGQPSSFIPDAPSSFVPDKVAPAKAEPSQIDAGEQAAAIDVQHREQEYEATPPWRRPDPRLEVLNGLKDEFVVPAVEKFQKYIGKPIVDKIVDGVNAQQRLQAQGVPQKPGGAASAEYLIRKAFSPIGGEPSEPAGFAQRFPSPGHRAVAGFVAGAIPWLFVPETGVGAPVGESVTAVLGKGLLPRLLAGAAHAGAEGLALGTLSAATTRGAKIEQEAPKYAAAGAGLGLGLGAAGEGVGAFADVATAPSRLGKTVEAGVREGVASFAKEANAKPLTEAPIAILNDEGSKQLATELAAAPATRLAKADGSFVPSVAVMDVRPKGFPNVTSINKQDALIRVYEVSENGTIRFFEKPLNTHAEGSEIGKYLDKHNVAVTNLSITPDVAKQINNDGWEALAKTHRGMAQGGTDLAGAYGHPAPRDEFPMEPENLNTGERQRQNALLDQLGWSRPGQGETKATPELPKGPTVLARRSDGKIVARVPQAQSDTEVSAALADTIKTGSRDLQTTQPISGGGGSGRPPSGPPSEPPQPPPNVPPPPPPGPGDLTPNDITYGQVLDGLTKAEMKSPGTGGKILQQLVGGHVRGPKDAAQVIALQRAIKQIEADGVHLSSVLEDKLGSKATSQQFQRDLQGLAEAPSGPKRDLIEQRLNRTYAGSVWAKHREGVLGLLQERDLLNEQLAMLGAIPEEKVALVNEGKIDAYVARDFLQYLLPKGEWAKIVRKDNGIMDAAVNGLGKDLGMTADEIAKNKAELIGRLMQMVEQDDPVAHYATGIGRSQQNLKSKLDLPKWLQDFLGRNEGASQIGITLGTQRANAARHKLWFEVDRRADWSAPKREDFPSLPPEGKADWKRMPNNPREFGAMADKWIHPYLYDELVKLPATIENSKFLFHNVTNILKANVTVLNPTSWINNVSGNIFSHMKAGGIDPIAQPLQAGRLMAKALAAYADHVSNGNNPLIKDAIRYGADVPGQTGTEMTNLQSQWVAQRLKSYRGNSYFDWLRFTADTRQSPVLKYAGIGYDAIDRVNKLAAWMGLIERYKAKPDIFLKGVRPESIDIAAKRLAALNVNRSFQSFDKLGSLVDTVNKRGAGIVNPFFSTMAEDMRIVGDIPAHMKDDPTLKWRLMRYMIAMGAMYGAGGLARRTLGGVPDTQVDAAMANLTKAQRPSEATTAVLPYKDSQGRIQIHDLSSHVPLGRFIQWDADKPLIANVLGTMFPAFASSQYGAQDVMKNAMAQFGGSPAGQAPLRPGEAGVLHGISSALSGAAMPRFTTNAFSLLRRYQIGADQYGRPQTPMGGLAQTEEPLTGPQVGLGMAGLRVEPVGKATELRAKLQNVGEISGYVGAIRSVAKLPDNYAKLQMLDQIAQAASDKPFKKQVIESAATEIRATAARMQKANAAKAKVK